jgi:branched-chain amino acid transport system substrate-binding protein
MKKQIRKSYSMPIYILILMALLSLGSMGCTTEQETQEEEITIGLIAPITGEIANVGQSSVNAANMFVDAVNENGGVQVGDQKVKVTLLIEDDQDQAETAVSAAQKLINQDGVVAIIGPQASRNAIPAATIAENARIPMISPWSTNPDTTAGKEYVFRTAFIDPFQGRILARFALEEQQVTKAAILYDKASPYNRDIADIFKTVFEEAGGEIVAFEAYTTGEEDFSTQLAAIKESGAELLFLPNYYNELQLQTAQMEEMGIEIPLLGSDSWGGVQPETLPVPLGAFYSAHYAPDIASDVAQTFIQNYQDAYGETPDDVAALTYDAFGMLFQAITDQNSFDPEAIRNGLGSMAPYEGVTGTIAYQGSGDPVKSAIIMQIKDGQVEFYTLANP